MEFCTLAYDDGCCEHLCCPRFSVSCLIRYALSLAKFVPLIGFLWLCSRIPSFILRKRCTIQANALIIDMVNAENSGLC